MPELKRQFGGGAMNKDLDERLLPNGKYRDALNIQVATSEGSDVGTVQNILGNRLPYGTALSNLGANAKCIGVYENTRTEMIYWFIASDTKSLILEYDQTLNIVSPVLVDTVGVLRFNEKFFITGINIIDDLLFFTDNQTEPKKLNIKTWKAYNSSNTNYTHTQVNSANFTEDQITVIKKAPEIPPTITMSASRRTGVVETTLLQKRFSETTDPFDPIATGDYGTVTFTTIPNFEVGDKLRLTLLDGTDEAEIIVSITQEFFSSNSATFRINVDTIPSEVPEGLKDWKVVLIEEKPMFEFKFPRFACRYKYDDNEYSYIGPYSEVAFLPGDFEYNPKKGFNKGMVNTLRSLKVGGFAANAPHGVKEIDILYKDTASNNVYTVQSVKTTDPEYTAGTNGEVEITSDVIFKVLPSIQQLRVYDNVPKKAKAQALSANRIMYGNYFENYDMKDAQGANISVKFDVSIVQNPDVPAEEREPYPSIKSLRTYQVGVVYRDKYGRETPVFTDPTGSFILDKLSAANYNVLKVKITSPIPHWAESYKYYVKESSDEYYNLAMDRHYPAEDGNVWLAFASADRNKVTDETLLILKKRHDDNSFVSDEARYKIISIENEAPDFIKTEKITQGVLTSVGSGVSNENIFLASGFPQADRAFVHILQTKWSKIFGGADNADTENIDPVHQKSDLQLRVLGSNSKSKFYDIANIKFLNVNPDYYEVELREKFETDDISFTGVFSNSDTTLSLEIVQKQIQNSPEYGGRFFTKIERDGVLEAAILSRENEDDNRVKSSTHIYANSNAPNSSQSYWRNANKGVYPGGAGENDTKHGEWFLCRNIYRHYRDAGGTLVTNGSKYRGGLGGVTSHDNAHDIRGFGAQAGNDFMEIAYHWWGGPDRNAWQAKWTSFEFDEKPEYKNLVNCLQTVNTKFRFTDDPDQTVYTIKGFRRSNIGAFKDGKIGRWASMRVLKWTLKLDKPLSWVPEDNGHTTKANATQIEFLDIYVNSDEKGFTSENPAIWETEPKDITDLNIFFEVDKTHNKSTHGQEQTLSYSNCWSFGNGVESDRIRDDFNAPRLAKGIKASTVLEEPYAEEHKSNFVIFSGLYNSTSGTNNTNQFIQADQITKSINPVYGSIQLMRHRHGGLDVLCEDKCFKIPTDKDILFTADGSKQVTVSSNVLGTPNPYTGEFGISKNPESYTSYGYRAYFSDKDRGVILRLSNDGLEPISRYGMEDYFKDNLAASTTVIGSYDSYKKEFNVTLNHDTVSFKETTNAWTSRKSFLQEEGVSLNNKYYTFKKGDLWVHDNETRNNFYGVQYNSTFKFIYNDAPNSIKQFKTINYEGSQARIFVDNDTNGDGISNSDTDNYFPNRVAKAGWWTNSIESDKQSGQVLRFEEKEGKWFNYIQGTATNSTNIDTGEFSVQGIGSGSVAASADYAFKVTITVNENND